MEICMVAKDFAFSPSLKEHVERRLGFALTQVRTKVARIVIRLRDLNGPRGGRDKVCQINIFMPGQPEVVIREIQEDMYFAIDSAVKRAAHRAVRLLTRRRHLKREAPTRTILDDKPEDVDPA